MTKKTVTLIALIAVAAVLCGAVFFLLRDDGEEKSDDRIKIIDVNADDISKIELTNSNGELKFNRCDVGGKSVLRLDGYEDIPALTQSYDSLAGNASKLIADRVYKENEQSDKLSDYGFEKPFVKFTLTLKGGQSYTVLIGDQTPDKAGYYAMCEGKNNVYIVDNSLAKLFDQPIDNFVSLRLIEDTYSDSGLKLNSIKLSGGCREYIEVKSYEDEVSSHQYVLTKPYDSFANEESITTLRSILTGDITADRIAVLHPSDKDKTRYGFDKPYSELNFTPGDGKSVTLIIGKKADKKGRLYVMTNNAPSIYEVAVKNLKGYDFKISDMESPIIFSCGIDFCDKMTVTLDGKNYGLAFNAADSTPTATLDGKSVDYPLAAEFYARFLSVRRTAVSSKKPSGQKLMTVDLKYNIKRDNSKIEYYRQNGKLYCFVDGKAKGDINQKDFDNMCKSLKAVS